MRANPATMPNHIPVTVPGYQLNANHRCDSCGARAYVRVVLDANCLDLLFCAHHFRKHSHELQPKCIYINDERQQLRDGIKDDHWVEGKPESLPPRQKQPWEDK